MSSNKKGMVIEMKNNLRQYTDDKILIAAHRGSWGANLVPNTCAAFENALRQGAAILEMDLAKSADGEIFIFHTGTEPRYLGEGIDITRLTGKQIRELRMINCDGNATDWRVNTFEEVLELTKGRCILNLDRCSDFFDDVAPLIRRHGMENQILMKSAPTKEGIARIENSQAANCMYLPILKETKAGWDLVKNSRLNLVGAEIVFATENAPILAENFVEELHSMGLEAWGNSLVYSYKEPLSAGHNDDISLSEDPEKGWGWLVDHKFDIIQTDWPGELARFLAGRK